MKELKQLDPKAVGRRLAQFRCAFNLSGGEASAAAGWFTEKSAWSQCETGMRIPEPEYLCNLCDCYKVTTDFFYRGSMGNMPADVIRKLERAARELKGGNGFRKKAPGRPPQSQVAPLRAVRR